MSCDNPSRTMSDKPHRRYNPLTDEWLLVSPHRTKRPWQGQEDEPERVDLPEHDPSCYLCPGTVRANGETNPDYSGVHVFTNDFSALLPGDSPDGVASDGDVVGAVPSGVESDAASVDDGLFVSRPESGICRVICYSARHNLTMARMTTEQIEHVIETWRCEYLDLGEMDTISYVQIFENRGALMGCSNPHPHGQIWASSSVPTIPAREAVQQEKYLAEHGECMLCRYLQKELESGERVVFENDSFVVLVPFWAVWPYETMILPKGHNSSMEWMTTVQQADLADALKRLTVRYDNLFQCAFPYSMGIHQKPTDGKEYAGWHCHMHFYPPLLRSQSVRKFMVGFEMLGMAQRDITPEQSAARLRELSDVHYLDEV